MRWPWSRPEPRHAWRPPERIPDGETVVGPGQRRWADLLDQHTSQAANGHTAAHEPGASLYEPTRALPVYRPLLTPGQAWRAFGGRRGA